MQVAVGDGGLLGGRLWRPRAARGDGARQRGGAQGGVARGASRRRHFTAVLRAASRLYDGFTGFCYRAGRAGGPRTHIAGDPRDASAIRGTRSRTCLDPHVRPAQTRVAHRGRPPRRSRRRGEGPDYPPPPSFPSPPLSPPLPPPPPSPSGIRGEDDAQVPHTHPPRRARPERAAAASLP